MVMTEEALELAAMRRTQSLQWALARPDDALVDFVAEFCVASDNVIVTRGGSLNTTVVRSGGFNDRGYPEASWSGFKLQQPLDGHAARVRAMLRSFMR